MAQYKIYHIDPAMYYYGFALIAAPDAATANQLIADEKERDPENRFDSFGLSYVREDDAINNCYGTCIGFLFNSIRYCGC